MVDPQPVKCPWCDFSHVSVEHSLRIHAQKAHGESAQSLYDALYCLGGRPTCKCGCGTVPKFFGLGRGYGEWIRGHVSRVRNNWGHNEKALKKSHETCNEKRARGEMPIWNRGKTIEDERVRAYVDGFQGWLELNPEERMTRAKRMRDGRLDGTIPTQRGPNHSQWKGGLSSINNLAHSLLYKAWIFPKMKAGNFTCASCGATDDICVHHSGDRFSDLLREAASQVGYDGLVHDNDFDKKSEVAQRLVDLHLERDVPGVVLCRECHALAHETLGEFKEAAVIRGLADPTVTPFNAPTGSCWKMRWRNGQDHDDIFIVLDGLTDQGDRRVLFIRDVVFEGNVRQGSHMNRLSVMISSP